MKPPFKTEPSDLADWVAQAAAVQGIALGGDLLREVVAFVAVARDMALALPQEDETP